MVAAAAEPEDTEDTEYESSNNNSSSVGGIRRTYKQKIEYYNEILTHCKYGPRSIHYLMLAVENTNTKSFRNMFDPLVKNGYLKKYNDDVYKNTFTITDKGIRFWEDIQTIVNDLKILNGGLGFLDKHDIMNKIENETINKK